MVQVLEKEYEGRVNVKIYRAGKDFDYIKKYGATTKSMLIINEKKAITKLTKPAVRQAFEEALKL
ncbi:thioredoxin-like protein [bacterium]|nr:thioredoxin-like protein [bacterium]MCI7150788.1 thioredoxin-like protein [bacterium]